MTELVGKPVAEKHPQRNFKRPYLPPVRLNILLHCAQELLSETVQYFYSVY